MRALKGYLLIAMAASFWGIAGTAAKYLFVRNVDPLIIVQARVTFSCLLLFLYFSLFRREYLRVTRKDLVSFAVLGILGVAGSNFFYYYAIDLIPLSGIATAILLQYTAPIFVILYARIFQREPFHAAKVLALLLCVVGCFLAVGGGRVSDFVVNAIGILFGLGASICFAFFTIYGRASSFRYPTWTVLLYTLLFASAFWLVVNPAWVVLKQQYALTEWLIFASFSLISILIPYTLYLDGLKHILSSRAIITSTLEPIVAVATAYFFLGELLSPLQIFGAVLVLSGIAMLQIRREEALVRTSGR